MKSRIKKYVFSQSSMTLIPFQKSQRRFTRLFFEESHEVGFIEIAKFVANFTNV